ncbi:MAG: hypothetical protein ACXVI9_07655 [Mucilaginibacter sp.]
MKEMSDEELQQWLENNKQQLPAGEALSKDSGVYNMLFEALGKEPENSLPYDFAAKIARRVVAREKRSNELKYNLVAALIFIAALGFIYSLLAFFTPDQAFLLLKYKWILLLFPPAFMAIQYFDQRLVKARIFNSRSYNP